MELSAWPSLCEAGELGSCYWMMGRFHGMARCVHLTAALLQAVYRSCLFASTGCHNFRDPDLRILIDNLPSKLQSLRLDLAYTGLERLDDLAGASFGNALQTLVIRFAGSLRSISGLSALLCPSLRRLELWLSDLPDLEDIELGVSNKALLKLRLEELAG